MYNMRLLVDLESKRDCEYINHYHHKLQGRIWKCLDGTPLEKLHNTSKIPKFCYSNPYPRKNYSEGENLKLLISSPHYEIIDQIEKDLDKNPEFNIGEMPLEVQKTSRLNPSVGNVGSSGTIQNSVGVYIPLSKEDRDEYNINGFKPKDKISWTTEHPLELFNDKIIQNISWKLKSLNHNSIKTPNNIRDVFTSVEFGETYPVEVPIGEGANNEFTFIVTQVRCDYDIKSDIQRKWLNTVVENGLGWRNPLGFGFVNIKK